MLPAADIEGSPAGAFCLCHRHGACGVQMLSWRLGGAAQTARLMSVWLQNPLGRAAMTALRALQRQPCRWLSKLLLSARIGCL